MNAQKDSLGAVLESGRHKKRKSSENSRKPNIEFSTDFKADFVGFIQKPNKVGFFAYSRVIADDYDSEHRKLSSKVDKKLRRTLDRKKQELGIKPDGMDMHY